MQKTKGFQYATKLYLDMEYHNIRLSHKIQDMTKIVPKFWKFRYKCLPIGM